MQAIIRGTKEQLEHLLENHGMEYDLCHVFDNGTFIYEDSGDTILQRYTDLRNRKTAETPDWDSLSKEVQIGLMMMAGSSVHWQSEGDLDRYLVEQFEEEHGNIFIEAS